jgi:hypothetical protein
MIESGLVTRSLVLAALTLATLVMFAVSLRGNYLYGLSIGQSEEKRQLFAWANVAADVWKAFGLIAVTMLWRARRRRAALLASFAWFVCLLFGINSALGIYVQDRAALTGGREDRHATYIDTAQELASIEGKLRAYAHLPSIEEIDARIEALLQQPITVGERVRGTVASLSRDCSKIDARTINACRQIAELRVERSAAVEAGRLQERARVLRDEVVSLRESGSSLAPDPVGEFYAWISGGLLSVRDVGFGFPLFFALIIEVVSALGALTIAAYAEASRSMTHPAAAGCDALDLAVARRSQPEDGHVLSWLAERGAPASETWAVGIGDLYEDYVAWCADGASYPLPIADFEEEFDDVRGLPELAGKIRKFRDRYYGIALARGKQRVIGRRSA